MRLIGNPANGELFWSPMPLEIAPGRPIWNQQRGTDYVVFVDESFHGFFGFDNPNGYFCHSAVGIPERNYEAVQRRLGALVTTYEGRARRTLGQLPGEIKFSVLRRMPPRFQARFVREVATALQEHGGFISGFYTPTRGFIMERVREDLLDIADEVPGDSQVLYEAARRDLLASMRGPGQAELIARLLFLPVAAIKFMLGGFECRFRIQYDPRNGREDRAVREAIGFGMNQMLNLPAPFDGGAEYLGLDANRRSEQEVGLQLADVAAGFVRDFFATNPDALTEGSTARLITPNSNEPLQKLEPIGRHLFKTAALTPMSAQLRRKVARRNMANLISYFYPVLASGILTCTTSNGQERDLELSTGLICDLLD
jgi:hypothetical protein